MALFILILILILILGFLIVIFIGILSEPVGYSISLQSKDIPKNTGGALFYEISNYGYSKIVNVTVENHILDVNYPQLKVQNYSDLSLFDKSKGAYVFSTDNLQRGEHIVESTVYYVDKTGSMLNKSLTLHFNVI